MLRCNMVKKKKREGWVAVPPTADLIMLAPSLRVLLLLLLLLIH